jgi:GntR family transcriptional regulator
LFSIDYKSRLPFYEQLVENIKSMVLSGLLKGDDPLPSVRQLSGELGINPNTVQKAYTNLEQMGVLYTVPGKGNFIRSDTEALRQDQTQALFNQIMELMIRLKALGVSQEQLLSRISEIFGEEEKA